MNRVAVVDYGMGNLDSVVHAFREAGAEAGVTRAPDGLFSASHIVLPGVGSFAEGMTNLRDRGFDQALRRAVVEQGRPFLGICLGMQLLAGVGVEGGRTEGLGWVDAEVAQLSPASDAERIPHVGWNSVEFRRADALFEGIPEGTDFYFVHSYHVRCSRAEDAVATTPYCGGFVSSLRRENVIGVQFHPEKSQRPGARLIRNFLALT